MKTRPCCSGIPILLAAFLLLSCSRLGEDSGSGTGILQISFLKGGELFTKAYPDIPDTADFLLKITDSSGEVIFDGVYGDCRESMEVKPGSYNVRVLSSDFRKPAFDSPLFGDEQCVVVPDSGTASVALLCRQMNAGVRLVISPDFLDSCKDAVLFLKSGGGRLMYSYSERRTAYFEPGQLSLIMSENGTDQVLMVRELAASEMLSLKVTVASSDKTSGYEMSVGIDTSRVWTNDECVIGGVTGGMDSTDALSISEARNSPGMSDVWVCGYIVGGDLTSSSASFAPPFKSRTNILLAPRSTTVDRDACLSVQLPDNEVREKLNLVDNPGLLGKRVLVKGDVVEAYYGIPGLKSTSEFIIY